MKILGKVLEIFSAKMGQSGLPRPKVESLELIVDYGIKNDKFAQKNLEQTVLIVGKNSYELAKENAIELKYGSFGENILLDFDPHKFSIGDIFNIGESSIQITQICSICSHLSVFDKKLPTLLKDNRGLYCKILSSGIIKKDMKVQIKEKL